MREKAGDGEGAEALYRRAANTGDTDALLDLAAMRKEAGDGEGAEALYRRAANTGNTSALRSLEEMREEIGDHTGAEAFARQAANAGNISFRSTERWPYGLDPDGTPTLPWSVAEDAT
ncbi:hypothetical protein [Streptomyces noursei]|uniref:hypothetical protein n=1 Tax=Streptomyces noursei TaxID=1971 RepID=UPI000B1851D9|nr:hypothetical protein [Streptomyces noursei]